ncbi:MAG: hypothetical protein IKZ13_02785 [Akkermansia sp.]|nr:hypothetical protein [Akkermansia sp.]
MGSKFSKAGRKRATQLATTLMAAGTVCATGAQDVVPLPSEVFGQGAPTANPVIDLTDRMIAAAGNSLQPQIPETLTINNQGGEILYDNEKQKLTYKGSGSPVELITDAGLDVDAAELTADMSASQAILTGPLTVYQGESLTLAERGVYDWKKERLDVYGVKAKVSGLLVRGSHIEYAKDDEGKNFMRIHDAYVSADDAQVPDTWVGAGELTVYPGDYGRVTRLSIASGEYDIPIPIVGWISFSHSLNPQEGYLPNLGSKSVWGTYLLNSYGFLLGNRRVEGAMPVADYVLTAHADYRTRRGFATGLDLEDVEMAEKYSMMTGIATYFAYDEAPMINPTTEDREHTDHQRYRIAMSTLWDLPSPSIDTAAKWTLGTNVDVLSDRYMLRDFFEDISRENDKPDNTIRLVRKDTKSQTMVLTRFAPNDYYSTDERAELSYYRVRSSIGRTGISYETRNSFGIMRQYVPFHERQSYKQALENIEDQERRDYYKRLLNTNAYARANSTHEFTTQLNILKFLNITPKAGVGYSGYYGVDEVGADNRFLGFVGVDANIKFHKRYDSFNIPSLGFKGLTHVIKPYTTLSHCNISSSNPGVPQIDMWSNEFGTATSNPMELDLMGFTGIDSWGTWSVWRIGMQNTLTTTIDGERHSLFNWNVFIDYNEENPTSTNQFSNLYSLVTFRPAERFYLRLETQTPTIKNGDEFKQVNASVTFQPFAAFEARVGYRSILDHPIQYDAEQVYIKTNLRINEKYTFACQWNWDIENKRLPIQQYSLFRKSGTWYVGGTLFMRNNGGKKETGFGISFTVGETGTSLPISFF